MDAVLSFAELVVINLDKNYEKICCFIFSTAKRGTSYADESRTKQGHYGRMDGVGKKLRR